MKVIPIEKKKKKPVVDMSLYTPNKYNITTADIGTIQVRDWRKLKKYTWYNDALETGSRAGKWWCHCEGCQEPGQKYDDFDEFWIGFDKKSGKVDYWFTAWEGMCRYEFDEFYAKDSYENLRDLRVQSNVLQYLNTLIDEGIISIR